MIHGTKDARARRMRRLVSRFRFRQESPRRTGGEVSIPSGIGAAVRARIDALVEISAEPGRLTRVYLSPEHRRANALVMEWMRAAGMSAREDAAGNVIGRLEG